MSHSRRTHVVTAFVRHEGDLLFVRREGDPRFVRRENDAPSASNRWDGVSQVLDEAPSEPEATARGALRAQVGIEDATFLRRGVPVVSATSGSTVDTDSAHDGWIVYPVLFSVDDRTALPSELVADVAWLPASAIRDRPTVPGLWRAYQQVAPTIATVAEDTEHGSARISIRALEVLRDRAVVTDNWGAVADVARELRAAHPDMAALTNRINRAMARATNESDDDTPARTPAAVAAAAQRTLAEAVRSDEQAARQAGTILDDDATVATLSRSGTVFDALLEADPVVLIGESRPAGEGGDVATELAAAGVEVTLTTDAALSWAIADDADTTTPDVVLVGADAVLPDGTVVNKVGTRALGLAASRAGIPLYAVAARDKVAISDRQPDARSDSSPLNPGSGVRTWTPTFDRTPPDCMDGIVTEDGVLAPRDVEAVVERHRRHAAWDRVDDG